MTYSVLGIDTTQVKEIDPRTGKEKLFYVPKINQQTGKEERVLLPKSSRLQGTYLIGATGTGKTGTLKNLAMQDIRQGIGVCVLDPHGDLINDIIAGLSDKEVQRVILLDTLETEYQGTRYYPGLNIFQCDDPTNDLLAQETYERIKHIFNLVALANNQDQLGVRVSQGIRSSAFTFIDSFPTYGCTMLELPVLYGEEKPRTNLTTHLRDESIRLNYWENFFNGLPKDKQREWADMVLNKVEGYTTNRLLRPIIGQSRTTINFRKVMDTGKILLIKLPGEHEEMTELLGSLVIAQILAAAFSRRDIRLEKRRQFNIYCDEFELYASDDFTRLLKECRKYGMAVTLAHQSRDFIDLKNKAASLQVANLIVLRIIRKDADEIAGNFDCRSVRTRKVLRQKTEPKYREWDETVWVEDGEALYKEAVAQYETHYETRRSELTQRLARAEKQEQEALVRWEGAANAQGALSSALIGDHSFRGEFHSSLFLPFHPVWYSFKGERDTWATARNYWIEDQEHGDVYNGRGWTDEKVEQTIEGLVEVKSRTLSDSFEYSYLTFLGEKTKRVDYTYLEREERYALAETTLTLLQVGLQEQMARASAETKRILSDIYDELSEIVKPLLRLGVWFKPELKPSTLPGKAYREFDPTPGKLPSYTDYLPIIGTWWTREAGEMLMNWPLLAKHPQPTIGEKRTVKGWTRHGVWYLWKHNNALDWLDKWRQTLKELCEQRRVEQLAYQEQVSSIKQQLNELKAKDEETRREIKARYQKIEHRKEYVGEQPVVEEKTRISITRPVWGSSSTTESVHETPFYEWVEEPDQTPDQRRDEIAGEIATLPDYVARIRIKEKKEKKEKKGENEELVEYTIRTLKPESGLQGIALEKRIARIKETMIGNNIIRPQHEINEEIRKRQQVLRLPPRKPSETQKFLPPPEDEPPITRRG